MYFRVEKKAGESGGKNVTIKLSTGGCRDIKIFRNFEGGRPQLLSNFLFKGL
jgi:hypothetical protein